MLAHHPLDDCLDVVVVQHLERAADDGAALLGHALGAAGSGEPFTGLPGDVHAGELVLDHLLGEEVGLHELAQRSADLILAARDDGRVRDLDAHGVLEQGGDGEPVGQRTHHAALCRRADVLQPRIFLLQRETRTQK